MNNTGQSVSRPVPGMGQIGKAAEGRAVQDAGALAGECSDNVTVVFKHGKRKIYPPASRSSTRECHAHQADYHFIRQRADGQ